MSSNATNQPKSTIEIVYMCPMTNGPPAGTFKKNLEYKYTSTKIDTPVHNLNYKTK